MLVFEGVFMENVAVTEVVLENVGVVLGFVEESGALMLNTGF